MSRWTHVICSQCYTQHEPGREPVKIINPVPANCCFCGKETSDGIFYRFDPEQISCKGVH